MTVEAAADLRVGIALTDRLDGFASWYEAQTRIVLARAAARLGEVGQAQDLLGEARRLIRPMPEATLLADWLRKAEEKSKVISDAGVDELTPAELRILLTLQSHHSLPEIAARAHVSPKTVKSQAQAVYRKLGVSARREAVERARAIGLIRSESEAS